MHIEHPPAKAPEVKSRPECAVVNYPPSCLQLIAKVIQAEAEGESMEGRIMVGRVILNRAKESSIQAAVFAKGQFNGVSTALFRKPVKKANILAAEEAIRRGACEYRFFLNPVTATDWRQLQMADRAKSKLIINNHLFF